MKKAHETMHELIADAVIELRRTRNWSQAELAREIAKNGRYGRPTKEPGIDVISKWENAVRSPDSDYRAALARIAKKDKRTEDLAPLFLASMNTWHVVSQAELLRERRNKEANTSDPR